MRPETVRRWAPLVVAAVVLTLVGAVWGLLRLADPAGEGVGGAGSSSTGPSSTEPPPLRLTGWHGPVLGTPDPRYHLAPGADLPDGPGTAEVRAPGAAGGTAYPLVTAREAYDALIRTPLPMPLMACPEPLPAGTDPVPCGLPVTVTGARLDHTLQQSEDGPVLVPTWVFSVEDSPSTLEQLAVVPRLLEPVTTADGTGGGTQVSSRFTAVARGADDRTLDVTFWGGVAECYSYDVRAAESPQQVSLVLVEHRKQGQQVCIDLAREITQTVRLGAPLGQRRVVDPATDQTLLSPSR